MSENDSNKNVLDLVSSSSSERSWPDLVTECSVPDQLTESSSERSWPHESSVFSKDPGCVDTDFAIYNNPTFHLNENPTIKACDNPPFQTISIENPPFHSIFIDVETKVPGSKMTIDINAYTPDSNMTSDSATTSSHKCDSYKVNIIRNNEE